MEKIKIIELLQRVSNGTQPDEIFYNKSTYRWIEENNNYYRTASGSDYISFEYDNYIIDNLNDYVEIIEEDKKIEKLELVSNGSTNSYALLNEYGTKCGLTKHSKIMCDKINEIIDYINKENK